jgi:hypothetical protein
LPWETLLLLSNKYKDVPSKSTGMDACAGAYMEELLSATILIPFLLSLIHREGYLVVTPFILI